MGLKRVFTRHFDVKQIKDFAGFLIDISASGKAIKILSDQCNFTPMEANRFIIGAGILNLSISTVYLMSKGKEESERTIDSITAEFLDRFYKANDQVCLGDIVVYKPELNFIFEEHGLHRNSMIDYGDLVSLLLIYRHRRYVELQMKALNEAMDSRRSWKMFSLLNEFIKHFSGKNNVDDLGYLSIPITGLLEMFQGEIYKYCDNLL